MIAPMVIPAMTPELRLWLLLMLLLAAGAFVAVIEEIEVPSSTNVETLTDPSNVIVTAEAEVLGLEVVMMETRPLKLDVMIAEAELIKFDVAMAEAEISKPEDGADNVTAEVAIVTPFSLHSVYATLIASTNHC